MKKRTDHTFIVLAYNESPFLEKCLRSLKQQTVESDILISTSTPNKKVQQIASKYQIKLVIGKGEGIANDWNNAYKICKTRFLTLAHQDDVYLPKYTENCLRLFDREEGLLVFTDYAEVFADDEIKLKGINLRVKRMMLWPYLLSDNLKSVFFKKLILSFGNPICCPSVMFNVNKIGRNFKFDSSWSYDMDWAAWLKLSKRKGVFYYVREVSMHHRIHDQSETSRQIGNKNRIEEERRLLKLIWPSTIVRMIMYLYSFSYRANRNEKK